MSRPPERNIPQILFTRGTHEWITRVSKKHRQLMDMRLSSGQKDNLDRWAEIEFVHSTLQLEGSDVSSQLVAAVFENRTQDNTGLRIDALLGSYRLLISLVKAKGKDTNLTLELLLKLHTVPGAGLRPKTVDQNHRIKSDQL